LLGVLGTDLGGDGILRALRGQGLKDLLQLALRVHVHGLEAQILDVGLGFLDDETADGFQTAIHVHGADEGLEGVCQCGGADTTAAGLLAFAHHKETAEADGNGVDLEPLAGNEAGAHFGQLAFGKVWKEIKEVLCEDELEDGVAEELKALIVKMMALGLVTEAWVGKRLGQEEGVAELVVDALLQRGHWGKL
jgi:hypothetical protein